MATLIEHVYANFPCCRSNGKAMTTRAEFARLFYPQLTTQNKDGVWLGNVLAVPANRHLLDCLVRNATKHGKPFSIQVLKQLAVLGFVQLAYPQGDLVNRVRRVRNHHFGQPAVRAHQYAALKQPIDFVIHQVWLA